MESYIERIRRAKELPPFTPEGFIQSLDMLSDKLKPKFIGKALAIQDDGEAQIIIALAEFDKRLRALGSNINPRTSQLLVTQLMGEVIITESNAIRILSQEGAIANTEALRHEIVHAPDPIRSYMQTHGLLMSEGVLEIKKLDRESSDYRERMVEILLVEVESKEEDA